MCSYSVKLVPQAREAHLASSSRVSTPLERSVQSNYTEVEPAHGMEPVVVDYTQVRRGGGRIAC